MSTMDDNDGIDWDALGEELFGDVDIDTPSVVAFSDGDLIERFHNLTASLRKRKELRYPRTQEARDLHSERSACLLELRRRKLLT